MDDYQKVVAYEVHIEDLLKAITERMNELSAQGQLDDFQKGRQLAFWEVMDMIKTRHAMILELIEDTQGGQYGIPIHI